MDRNQKKGIISFVSGLGVIFLFVGIFTDYYDFGSGFVVAMVFWIMSGVLSTFLGVDEETTVYPSYSNQRTNIQEATITSQTSFENTPTGVLYCSRCGSRVEKGSRFCSTCGLDLY